MQDLWQDIQTRFHLDSEQLQSLQTFYTLLLDYNKKINLISRKASEEDILINHFIDSLMICQVLDGAFLNKKIILDIGSGGGFPVIPLAIVFPQSTFYAVDSIQKKTVFLEKIKQVLSLSNLQVINQRVETLDKNFQTKCQVVTARAVTTLEILIKYAFPVLQDQGLLLAYKGPQYYEELILLKNTLRIQAYQYTIPFRNTARVLVSIQK